MRTIVHFGMSKSGSTALQKGLSRARESLLEQGILYPRAPIIPHSHNLLMAGLVPPGDLPRFVRHSLKRAGETPDLCDSWLGTVGEACARDGVRTLVFSAENLWGLSGPAPAALLRKKLQGIGATRIEAVAYLRRPSDWYLSMAGQVLVASHAIKPAATIPYRPAIEAVVGHLADPGAVRLHVYDRARFPEGDILAHFATDMLEGATLPDAAPRDANVTLSAEGMDLLRNYRLHAHPRENAKFTRDTRHFLDALKQAEQATPGHARPRLYDDIARKIDHGAPDLLWLREVHGLAFEGIDYEAIETGPWRKNFNRIDRLCPVDPARLDRLRDRVIEELATALESATRRRKKG
ncbi:hypothetical protein [Jannaschia formosa]|uniref:hypothetical protein n=1 Tax=Jannaschia formosa TaxID=2259592 RepID=UPI000E1B7D80|nr:hypothetical protein [Jannaschia formosa]TFL17110.1 hypothetical protein DR046_16355 [Jannaschia formosa]